MALSAATALGVREEAGQPLLATLVAALRARRLLLVLDNCEHLLEACAALVEALLRGCPQLPLLATSREALGIAGETAWRVPSLALPDAAAPAAARGAGAGRGGAPVRRAGAGRAAALRADGPERAAWWRRSAGGWTASRWRSSWPRRGCAGSRSSSWPPAWTSASGC